MVMKVASITLVGTILLQVQGQGEGPRAMCRSQNLLLFYALKLKLHLVKS